MKHTLGLDIGTNSLGWYLLKEENEEHSIADRGVIIFPIGTNVDPVKGLEKTKHAQRRGFRMASRNRFRKNLRKRLLTKILKEIGFMPERVETVHNFTDTYKVKGAGQSFELYKLRAEALDRKVEPNDLGRLFYLLNSYRGFKSGSKSVADEVAEKKKEDEGAVKDGIKNLKEALLASDSRTYGEYFYKMHLRAKELYEAGRWHNPNEPIDERALDEEGNVNLTESRGIRREHGRYTARATYEAEFDLIWQQQKEHYADLLTGSKKEYDALKERMQNLSKEERRAAMDGFKKTLYWRIKWGCIYYQRPLKSAKRYIGKCSLEPSKRTAPVSSFLYQDFRIRKVLADIRYSEEAKGIFKALLKKEWREALFKCLQTTPAIYLKSRKNKASICELLSLNEKGIKFNFDTPENDMYILGNTSAVALYEALGSELFAMLSSTTDSKGISKLEKLWHLLYMKKDDEWLRVTLHDRAEWGMLDDHAIEALIVLSFEDGYASYSSKALKKLMPFLEDGCDERTALESAGYRQEDERFDETKWELKPKVAPLKNGILRNPVVEKAVAETIKLVNAILEKHSDIDQRTWEIHIETTRELKKPKKEREKLRRDIIGKAELREEYAAFLNRKRKDGALSGILKREVQKYDPVISKFELWLEMGGDKDDAEFAAFSKLAKMDSAEQRIKHQLWLECNRICPYTGRVISLSKLFSPEVEIEHIIPLSRGLDNSFTNKTLTFYEVNKQKGNKTAYEFLKHDFKAFEARINMGTFSDTKKENFRAQQVPLEFTHAQIGNTGYIARFVRKKLQEVCKPHLVYFTNGRVTAELRSYDWRLSELLDKIRYEEATGIDIDTVLRRFNIVKKDFHNYYKSLAGRDARLPWGARDFQKIDESIITGYDNKTANDLAGALAAIEAFNVFRGKQGKKDRSDHRHHALDALITALCSPAITKELSTLNAARELRGEGLYDEGGSLSRDKVECPLAYDAIKQSLKHILVLQKTTQRLMVAKKNKIKRKSGPALVHPSKSVRASLHKDTFYGKLKDPAAQGIERPVAYVTRFSNNVWEFDNPDKLSDIYDKNLREIIRRRILWFGERKIAINEEAYKKYPLYRYSPDKFPVKEPSSEEAISEKHGKPLPVVKKVRTVYKNYRSIISLPDGKYADADGNYIMALYELREKDKKGKEKVTRHFKVLSSFEAVKAKQEGRAYFSDEYEKGGIVLPLMKHCEHIRQGDALVMYEGEVAEIKWDDTEDIKKRLFIVTELGNKADPKKDGRIYYFGMIKLSKHNVAKSAKDSYFHGPYKNGTDQKFRSMYHTQIQAVKVELDNLGNALRPSVL